MRKKILFIISLIFFIFISTHVFATTSLYETDDSSRVTVYYKETDGGLGDPCAWDECWDGDNQSASNYSYMADSDDSYADATALGGQDEPWMRFNVSIQENKANLNWVAVYLEAGTDGNVEHLTFAIANFTLGEWHLISIATTETTLTFNFSLDTFDSFDHIIDAENNLVLVAEGYNLDSPEKIFIDYMNVTVDYTSAAAKESANVSDSLTFSESSTKIGNFTRKSTQPISINTPITRIGNFFKSLAQSFSLTSSTGKIFGIIKTISESISSNIAIEEIYSSIRSLAESISFNSIISRITNIFRTLSQYFAITDVVSRGLLFAQEVSQSFNINAITSRIIGFIRLTSQLFTTNTSITNLFSYVRSLSQPIITGLSTIRSEVGVNERLVQLSITITDTPTRLLNLYRTLSESLTINIITTRIRTLIISISDSLTINVYIARTRMVLKSISDSLGITTTITRIQSLVRFLSQPIITGLSTIRSEVGVNERLVQLD